MKVKVIRLAMVIYRHYPKGIMSFKENVPGVQGSLRPPGGVEPLMGVMGQCPLKLKKSCHLQVKFAVSWHKKTTTDFFFWWSIFYFFCSKCSSRGNPRYRGKGYCLNIYSRTIFTAMDIARVVSERINYLLFL